MALYLRKSAYSLLLWAISTNSLTVEKLSSDGVYWLQVWTPLIIESGHMASFHQHCTQLPLLKRNKGNWCTVGVLFHYYLSKCISNYSWWRAALCWSICDKLLTSKYTCSNSDINATVPISNIEKISRYLNPLCKHRKGQYWCYHL